MFHLSDTRWSAHADATRALNNGYSEIRDVLERIANDENQKGETRNTATSLCEKMWKVETGFYTGFWHVILDRFNQTSKSLQSTTTDLNTAVALLWNWKRAPKKCGPGPPTKMWPRAPHSLSPALIERELFRIEAGRSSILLEQHRWKVLLTVDSYGIDKANKQLTVLLLEIWIHSSQHCSVCSRI